MPLRESPPTLRSSGTALLVKSSRISKRFGGLQAVRDLSFAMARGRGARRSSAPTARARPPRSTCSRASSTPTGARCASTADSLARAQAPRDLPRSAWPARSRSSARSPICRVLRQREGGRAGAAPRWRRRRASARAVIGRVGLGGQGRSRRPAGLTLAERKRLELGAGAGHRADVAAARRGHGRTHPTEIAPIVELIQRSTRAAYRDPPDRARHAGGDDARPTASWC